jgi:hypothetical protein
MPSRRTFAHALLGALIATPITLAVTAALRPAEARSTQGGGRARFYSLPLKDVELPGSADRFASCLRSSIAVLNDARGVPDRVLVLCHF